MRFQPAFPRLAPNSQTRVRATRGTRRAASFSRFAKRLAGLTTCLRACPRLALWKRDVHKPSVIGLQPAGRGVPACRRARA